MQRVARLGAAVTLCVCLLAPLRLAHASGAASDPQHPSHGGASAAAAVGEAISHGAHALGHTAAHVRDAVMHGAAEAVSAAVHLAHTAAQRHLLAQGNGNGNGNNLRKNPCMGECCKPDGEVDDADCDSDKRFCMRGVCVECPFDRKDDPTCGAMTAGERPRCHANTCVESNHVGKESHVGGGAGQAQGGAVGARISASGAQRSMAARAGGVVFSDEDEAPRQ